MDLKKLMFWKTLWRKYRQARTKSWLKRLNKMLREMDDKLKAAEFNRNQRRELKRQLVSNTKYCLETWLKAEE